jgi:hypothetical protein
MDWARSADDISLILRISHIARNLSQPLQVGQRAHKISGTNKVMTSKRDDRRKAAVEKQIDENLRRVYEQDVTEQIPDRFLALLEQLREQD